MPDRLLSDARLYPARGRLLGMLGAVGRSTEVQRPWARLAGSYRAKTDGGDAKEQIDAPGTVRAGTFAVHPNSGRDHIERHQ